MSRCGEVVGSSGEIGVKSMLPSWVSEVLAIIKVWPLLALFWLHCLFTWGLHQRLAKASPMFLNFRKCQPNKHGFYYISLYDPSLRYSVKATEKRQRHAMSCVQFVVCRCSDVKLDRSLQALYTVSLASSHCVPGSWLTERSLMKQCWDQSAWLYRVLA